MISETLITLKPRSAQLFFFSSKTIFFIFRWSIFFGQAQNPWILIAPICAISNMIYRSQNPKKSKFAKVKFDHFLGWFALNYDGKWLENELIEIRFTIFEFWMLKS